MRQTNFSGGELSPFLWGRDDLAMFKKGLRTCRNFFVSQQGAAVSRPGTRKVSQVPQILPAEYTGGTEPERPYRLVPFVAGDGSTCVLLFGEFYIRFFTLGAPIVDGLGNPYEVVTTYLAKDLWSLRFAQVGDVLNIVGANYAPRELRRLGRIDWDLTDIVFTGTVPPHCDVDAPAQKTTGFTAIADHDFGGGIIGRTPSDVDHAYREWVWMVSAVVKDPVTGVTFETLAERVFETYDGNDYDATSAPMADGVNDDFWVLYADKPITLRRADTAAPIPPNNLQLVGYRIYRGRGDVFGLIGTTKSREFVDVGDEPDFNVQPPRGTDPFKVPLGPFTALMRPFSVGFFQERRVFGGAALVGNNTVRQPGRLFLSATGDYVDFDLRLENHVPSEALNYEIASRQHERIEHLLELDKLLALTGSSVWSVDGGQGWPIGPDHVDVRRVDAVGSKSTPPLVVDSCALFVRTKGFGARALAPRGQDAGYQGLDISQHAEHLFVGKNKAIVDWAYAEDPWSVVWAVRSDGALLSLTFSHERQLAGWARHDMKYYSAEREQLDEAFVESVCAVPEGEEDAVYLVVRRTVNFEAGAVVGPVTLRFVERMTSRIRRVKADDADPEYTAAPTSAETDSLYPTDLCVDFAHTYAGPPTRTFTGLEDFLGKEVFLVGRGLSPLRFEVTAAAMDLEDLMDEPKVNALDDTGTPIFVAHIGLCFTGQLETLDIVSGDARLRKKTVERVGFEVDQSIGVSAGQDFDNLDDFEVREVSDDYKPVGPATALIDTPVTNTWDQSARAVLEQGLPLPVTVVGITRGLEFGG